jgi:hypothetical protein
VAVPIQRIWLIGKHANRTAERGNNRLNKPGGRDWFLMSWKRQDSACAPVNRSVGALSLTRCFMRVGRAQERSLVT